MGKAATRSTDVTLVVPVAEEDRAPASSFDRLGFERRTGPGGNTLFVVEPN